MLHAHGIFLLIHHSNLLIRSKSLQNWILKELKSQLEGLDLPVPKNIYVHFDLIKNEDWESKEWNKQRMKDYIEKNKSFDHNKTKVLDEEPNPKRNKIEEFQNRMDDHFQWNLANDDDCYEETEIQLSNEPERIEFKESKILNQGKSIPKIQLSVPNYVNYIVK
jgi:hypothetical protein